MKPLFIRQFRSMKWFFIAFLLLSTLIALDAANGYTTASHYVYNWGMADNHYLAMSFFHTAKAPMELFLPWMVCLTALMAFYQQYEANHPANGQMMASFPVTRGKAAAMQLMLGFSCILVAMLIYVVTVLTQYAKYKELIAFAIDMSPYMGRDVNYLAPWFTLMMASRCFLMVTCTYMTAMCVAGLFGNVLFSIGFVGGAFVTFLAGLSVGATFMYSLRSLTGMELPSLTLMGRNMYWLELWVDRTMGGELISPAPYYGMPLFVILHALLAVALVPVYLKMKKCLRIESLGNVLLYKLSRISLVAIITLWPLYLPMLVLTEWVDGREAYNPLFPIAFIPAIAVFLTARYFIIVKPQKRLPRKRRVAAMALAVLLVALPGAARAEDRGPVYDPTRLELDEAVWDRLNLYAKLRDEFTTDVWVDTGALSRMVFGPDVEEANFGDPYTLSKVKDLAILSYDTYVEVEGLTGVSIDIVLGDLPKLKALMDENGLHALSHELQRYIDEGSVRSTALFEDRVRMEIASYSRSELRGEAVEDDPDLGMNIYFTDNYPYRLKDDLAQRVDGAFLKNRQITRRRVFSNGVYDTASYGLYAEGSGQLGWMVTTYIPIHAVFEGDQLAYMTASVAALADFLNRDAIRGEVITAMMDALIAAERINAAEAKEVGEAILKSIIERKSTSGASGQLHWSVQFDRLRPWDDARVMIRFE